jgi:hypothetical protein
VVSIYYPTVKRKLLNLEGEPSKFWGLSTLIVFCANTLVAAAYTYCDVTVA